MADANLDPRAEAPEPEGKKTVEMPVVPAWAIKMTEAMKEGFRVTNANIEVVSNDLSVVKDRVTILESERTRFSNGVRALSGTDLSHEAQLAAEKVAREALATKVDSLTATQETQLAILSRLDKVASNPLVKTIVTVLGTALATWAASKGLK